MTAPEPRGFTATLADYSKASRTQYASSVDHPGYIDAEQAMRTRDNRVCECGHKNVSHGSYSSAGFIGIGNGPCGIDRDTRNAASGWLGDRCPCAAFTEKEAGA